MGLISLSSVVRPTSRYQFYMSKILKFLESLAKFDNSIEFQMLEIGAHPYEGSKEPFHEIINFFPNSKISAFELDKDECEKLNQNSPKGINFFPFALGKKKEKKKIYITNHPMCTSLYEPDEKLMKLYNNLEFASLKKIEEIETVNLDLFIKEQKIKFIDFIKIDIQGAELDVFQGGLSCLKNVLAIITEVEFIQLYKNQPLFGDVSSFLRKNNINFHKFLSLQGRTLKPTVLNNDPNFSTQHMWSDAMYLRNIETISDLDNHQMLKLSVYSYIYGSPDLTYHCLKKYDEKNSTNLVNLIKNL